MKYLTLAILLGTIVFSGSCWSKLNSDDATIDTGDELETEPLAILKGTIEEPSENSE
jgi:hypothetical protein